VCEWIITRKIKHIDFLWTKVKSISKVQNETFPHILVFMDVCAMEESVKKKRKVNGKINIIELLC
jgi:hypothetical protein